MPPPDAPVPAESSLAPSAPLSRLVLGTAWLATGVALPGVVRGTQARALLDLALDLGISALDTAAFYQLGGSERLIGDWMRSAGVRERVYLISKGGHPSLLGRARLARGDLERDIDASLRRLRTDRLELYLLHRDAPDAPLEPIAETLWSFVASGRVRAYGVSNWTHERFAALRGLAMRSRQPPPAASSPQFSLPRWIATPYPGCVSIGGPGGAEALRAYRAADAAVLAWSPLGGGWLRAPGGRARGRAYRGTGNDARYNRLTALAERMGCTPAQLGLAWVLAHGRNVHAIVGTRRPHRLAELPVALELSLSAEQISWLANGGQTAPVADS